MVWRLEQIDAVLAKIEGRDYERYAALAQDPITERHARSSL